MFIRETCKHERNRIRGTLGESVDRLGTALKWPVAKMTSQRASENDPERVQTGWRAGVMAARRSVGKLGRVERSGRRGPLHESMRKTGKIHSLVRLPLYFILAETLRHSSGGRS